MGDVTLARTIIFKRPSFRSLVWLNLDEPWIYVDNRRKADGKIYKGVSIDIPMIFKLLRRENPNARFPRLDTVLFLEEFVKENDGEFKKKQLWNALPKKIMYQTFSLILDYLIVSGKVSVDSEGKIGWIYYPEDVEKLLKKTHLKWRKNEK